MDNTNKNEQNSFWSPAEAVGFLGDDDSSDFNNEENESADFQSQESDFFTEEADSSEREILESTGEEFSEEKNLENKDSRGEDIVEIPRGKLSIIIKAIDNIKNNCQQIKDFLGGSFEEDEDKISLSQFAEDLTDNFNEESGESNYKIVEGVFSGQYMIGPDGKQYNVPANYASKSKLVEGDILKLTILPNGRFVYKQIGPIERIRITGRLIKDEKSNYFIESSEHNRKWRILTASVTYFKGQTDDEVIILVPKSGESNWAAVENIINKS